MPCSEDRRVTYAEITEEGRALFDEIFPKHVATLHEMMGGLDTVEKEQAIGMLKRLGKGAGV
ncbi:HTH-type transcriptional regulator MhqR [compost metagenome]